MIRGAIKGVILSGLFMIVVCTVACVHGAEVAQELIAEEEIENEYERSRIESVGEPAEISAETGGSEPDLEQDSEFDGGADDSPDFAGVETEEGFTDEYADSGEDESAVSELVESGSDNDVGEIGTEDNSTEIGGYDADIQDDGLTYLGEWISTGYCPCEICCGQWASGYTASGTLATEGRTVACGSLPIGTEIYIEGYGYRIVEDLGVEGEWVDIFYQDHGSASAHGLQYVSVYLVN